jgi:MFS family permease
VSLGLLFIAVGAFLQARVHPDSTAAVLIPGMVCIGLGAGLSLPPLSSAVMAAVPPERAGMAGGALNSARQLGLAIGVAVLGAVFSALAPGGVTGPGPSVAAALNTSYTVAGVVALVGATLVFALVRTPRSRTAEERPVGRAAPSR